MKTFRLKVDTVFEAEDLEDACFKLIEPFMELGDVSDWEVDVAAVPALIDHVGSFSLAPEGE